MPERLVGRVADLPDPAPDYKAHSFPVSGAGESGMGKETVVRSTKGTAREFILNNCGPAIGPLMESQLARAHAQGVCRAAYGSGG